MSRYMMFILIYLYKRISLGIVALENHTSHNLCQKHAVCEYSATLLSVIFNLLPGLVVARWVNLRQKCLHEYELQFSDYNVWALTYM